jgi:ABC-type antimicrobial peptide transport system permease subunit
MIVSETVVRRFFPGENPIGRRARFGPGATDTAWMTIVGVVNDVKDGGLAETSRGAFYLPMSQSSERSLWLVARSQAAPQALVPLIRRELSAMDPALPLSSTQTMEQVIDSSVAQPKFAMLLLTVFAAIALVLTAAGVYGVISYAVAQRTHEIGVRIALGARRAGVVGMVVRQVLAMAVTGVVLGGAGALAGGRLLASMLYDVRPTDPLTLAVVVSIVVSVAIAAAALPALRAARTDPIIALRG